MLIILLLIAPGIISSAYYCALQKISFKTVDFIVYAVIFMFLNNMFAIGMYYITGHETILTEVFFSYIGTVAKYGLLVFVASLTLPNILLVISKFHRGKKNV